MEKDPELEQVLCNALSLQEDYPDMYLPPSDQDKSQTTVGTNTELLSGMEMHIPLKDPQILQDTLLELYSILGIPCDAQSSRPMAIPIKQEQATPSVSSQVEPPLTSPLANRLKRPLTEEGQESSKTRDEEDKLSSTSSQKHRKRTLYNKQQTLFLQKQFDFNPYPDYVSRCYISQITRIPEPRIQVWFQNRRARYLTKLPKSQETEAAKSNEGKSFFVRGGPS